ncbi:MAG: serine/threonine protein kinase [Polyangiaceae bacterium]|nr:serine/threonine protein kinase [Polyangiaceae bacterium]
MKTQRFNGPQVPCHDVPANKGEALVPGIEILGRYVVVRTLGNGGMGYVVAARHKVLGNLHAIKFLLPQVATNPEVLARFEREAQAAAKLTSPHVARVTDFGWTDAGEPYIVMEYLEGRDLKSALRGGPLTIEDAIDYLRQVCHALMDAHENGIVHRDLKPANLFLTVPKNTPPLVKVLDFGIAKVLGGEEISDITVEDGKGGFLGTIPYMSPEHLKGAKGVDGRTDIWAMGVIAYELLTCKRPFHGLTKLDLVSNILDKDVQPERPTLYRPELPLAIERVIGRCLAKNREARYQTVQQLETALREAAGIPLMPPTRPRMASTTDMFIAAAQLDEGKTHERTHGKTQEGLTVTNPIPSGRSTRVKMALAGGGVLATSATVVGLVVALRGSVAESAPMSEGASLATSTSGNAMPRIVPEPSARADRASEPATKEVVNAGQEEPQSIGTATAVTAPSIATHRAPIAKLITAPPEHEPMTTTIPETPTTHNPTPKAIPRKATTTATAVAEEKPTGGLNDAQSPSQEQPPPPKETTFVPSPDPN